MSLITPYREQFLEADGITTTFPFDDHGDGFDAISKNYVKCEVYNADGSVIVPDFTVDLSAKTITITSLTTPDGQVLNAPQNGAIVRVYRDVPEVQNTTAQALQVSTAQQIVQNFDNIVAMIQELQYANEHFTLRSTLPQRDLQIDLLRDIDDQKLVYWDNEKRKLVVTNYRQDEVLLPADKEDILEQANAYSDEQNAVLESRINGKLTAVESQIDANADAMASLGDQVSGIEEKIPGDASATNQLATKADLVDLDGYVKKSGDTMTGDLAFEDYSAAHPQKFVLHGDSGFSIKYYYNNEQYPRQMWNFAGVSFFCSTRTGVKPFLGHQSFPWDNIYASKLNNGADIAIPTEGGTLARLEDLIDLRADINEADSELQTQITAQAAEIATKQDQLTAGDNIIISGNIISATGAGGGVGLDVIVVQELPESGEKGIIYLVPKDSAAPDVYDEYVWVTTTSTFELIGSTRVDLTGYVKNTDYATSSKGGVFKTSSSLYATSVTGAGFLSATSKSLSAYNDAQPTIFISKGTLENIKDDYVKRGVTANTITLTADEQTSARTWLNAVGKTDYANSSTGGVFKTYAGLYATAMTTQGFLYCQAKSLDDYKSGNGQMFIAKGTLDNVLTQYAKDDSVGLIIRRL